MPWVMLTRLGARSAGTRGGGAAASCGTWGDHLWRAYVRRSRLGPPHPRDRHRALQDLARPALAEGSARNRADGTHLGGTHRHNVRRRAPTPAEP
eukprot:4030025-Alexandrium_andersonii.AAC.1